VLERLEMSKKKKMDHKINMSKMKVVIFEERILGFYPLALMGTIMYQN
jgi:hypothetical protein